MARSNNTLGADCHRSYGTRSSPGKHDDTSGYQSLDPQEEGYSSDFTSKSEARQNYSPSSIFQRVLGGTGVLVLFVVGISVVNNTRASWSGAVASKHSIAGESASSAVLGRMSMSEDRAATPLRGTPSLGGETSTESSIPALTIRATNEYGEFEKTARILYSLEMVMEPFRETVLTVKGSVAPTENQGQTSFQWRLVEADEHGHALIGSTPVLDTLEGPQTSVTLTKPGTMFELAVKEYNRDGSLVGAGRATVACKYVRREIRTLTDHDREAFFDAMEIFYTIPTEVGKTRYGSKFNNYERITAYHDSKITDYCYHDGLQFLTSHAAFDLMMERYLQMINPSVTLPIWDFMVESSTLGNEWYNSVIFEDDWFGPAIGVPENNFMLTAGRFGNVSTIYDPDNDLVESRIHPNHNAYGYITSINNYQDLPRLTRTSSYCGLTSHATFATAEVFVACFHDNNNLYDWEVCMEGKVHGDLHGLLGGAFNCNTDMKAFSDQHPEYDVGLLSFVLEYLTFNYWPMNAFIPSANTCDYDCTKGQTEKCGCTCHVDAFTLSDEEVYSHLISFMTAAISKFTGTTYISYDSDAERPYAFKQDGERLGDEQTLLLMRYLIKIGCEPGAVGYMSTGASPMDPIFWVLHPMFEKAMHILWLSPSFRDTYTFEWVDGACNGSGYNDKLPFTENILGLGSGKTFLRNKELLELMHPMNPKMPYIYENFAQWGNTATWDPCPECSGIEDSEEQ